MEIEGQSRLYTPTVTEEYKHFAYLATFAGHPVTPSESIDAAWHLHLQYSKEYWTVFYGEVLRAPLHHTPGTGAPDEDGAYAQHYVQALESYRRTFGEESPADVQPRSEQPKATQASETIVPTRHVSDSVMPPPVSTTHPPMPSAWFVIGVSLITITTNVISDVHVLSYSGPRFLVFYLSVCVMACLLIQGLHRAVYNRNPWGAAGGSVPRQLTPAETALIAGDATRMTQVAALTLSDVGAARIVPPAKKKWDYNIYVVANQDRPPEHDVNTWTWLARQTQQRSPWPNFQDRLVDDAPDMADRPCSGGWMWTRGAMCGATLAAWVIVLVMLWLGVTKVSVGLSRGRPVIWLLVEMTLFGIVYWWVTARLIGAGHAGPTAEANVTLDVYRQRGQQGPRSGLLTHDLLWLTAFGDTSVLANTAWVGYRSTMGPPAGASLGGSGGDTPGNCSSSSNGSSSYSSSSYGSNGCGGCSGSQPVQPAPSEGGLPRPSSSSTCDSVASFLTTVRSQACSGMLSHFAACAARQVTGLCGSVWRKNSVTSRSWSNAWARVRMGSETTVSMTVLGVDCAVH